jgi:hypothetical protein
MKPMPWYLFIHPVWQLVVLYLGIKTLAIGFSKSQTWTFPIRVHRRQGIAFITFGALGAVIGFVSSHIYRSQGHTLRIGGHRFIAFLIIGFLFLIALSGLSKVKHWHRIQWLQALHPWFGVLTMGLIFAQLFIVVMKIIGW